LKFLFIKFQAEILQEKQGTIDPNNFSIDLNYPLIFRVAILKNIKILLMLSGF